MITEEDTVSPLGKMVMVVWLFLLMVITSSYTASLTSILTVQQLPSSITGIESLIASNLPIGYQVGSFAYNYMTDSLSISPSRLIRLNTPEDYERALRKGPKNGGVAAIVDELPYVELFLSNQTDFRIVGQSFTKSGWGFVSNSLLFSLSVIHKIISNLFDLHTKASVFDIMVNTELQKKTCLKSHKVYGYM